MFLGIHREETYFGTVLCPERTILHFFYYIRRLFLCLDTFLLVVSILMSLVMWLLPVRKTPAG